MNEVNLRPKWDKIRDKPSDLVRESVAFSFLTLNDTGMVAEYRLTAQDGRVEYFPVLGGTTEQLAYVSDFDDYVQTSAMQAAPTKTPVDADGFSMIDSEAGNAFKRTLWSVIKSTLKTYFDTLYPRPSQTGNAGKYLTTNGTSESWGAIDLSTKQDAAAFLTTLVGIGSTTGANELVRASNPTIYGNSSSVAATIRQDGLGAVLRLQRNNGGASGNYITCDNGTNVFSISRDGYVSTSDTFSSSKYNAAQFLTGNEMSTGWGSTGFNSKVIVAYCNSAEVSRFSASGLTIGASGTPIARYLSATATLDFPSIAANAFADLTITVAGAAVGDTVIVNSPASTADVLIEGHCWSANTITVRATNNNSTTARDPASGTYRATVIKH